MSIFPQINYIKCINAGEAYRMSYTAWGNQIPGGKTLICVHGLNRNCRDWDFVAKHFAKLGYYVIAPDIVGRGNSDYLTNWVGYNIPTYVNDILFMIKTLKLENIDYIGTSMGGLIGMPIAALPNNPIRKMVLNDVGPEIEITGLKRIGSYSATNPVFDSFEEAKSYLMNICRDFAIPSELEDFFVLTSFQKGVTGKYELKRDANISRAGSLAALNNKNIELWAMWNNILTETLVIRGINSDILSTETITRMKEIHPQTQSVILEGVGHAPYLYSESHMQILQDFLL